MLQYNYNYGRFSDIAYYGGLYDKMNLLESPGDVVNDGFLAFSSAIWTYMTPEPPMPSMHEIMTGFYVPNDYDVAEGITADFGATTNVISDGSECYQVGGVESEAATARGEAYTQFAQVFNVTATDTDCGQMNAFTTSGAANFPNYWFQKSDN